MSNLNVFVQTEKIVKKNSVWWVIADDLNNIVVKSSAMYPASEWLSAVVGQHNNAVEKLKLNPAVCETLGFINNVFTKSDVSFMIALTLLKEAGVLDYQFIPRYDEKGKISGDLGYLITDKT